MSEEPDFSGMLEGLLGSLGSTGVTAPPPLSPEVQAKINERILALLEQETLSGDHLTLLSILLRRVS